MSGIEWLLLMGLLLLLWPLGKIVDELKAIKATLFEISHILKQINYTKHDRDRS